jgi:uncharacterized membrane protein
MTFKPTHRYETLDALRGAAIVWMTVFHFCFDLKHFAYTQADFYGDPFWTWQRSAIVSLFLLCAGLSQAVAVQQGQSWPRFGRRWGQVALAAVLVSVGSFAMYPQSFIYFGVLHGLALMLIVARLTARCGVWLWPMGAVALLLPWAAPFLHAAWPGAEALNTPALNWLGLISRKPITEDYVPLLPWLGVLWWGVAAGAWVLKARPQWLVRPVTSALRPLVVLGRWSLSYYLLHQPVLMGVLMGVGSLR